MQDKVVKLQANASVYLPICSVRDCSGHGVMKIDPVECAEIRHGQRKVADTKFSCGHSYKVILEA